MEAAAGVAATRGVSLPMPSSQTSRKEWRAVSDHPVRNYGNEELDRSKLGQSDERLIYEVQQRADVDFCSITIDESLDSDILQQRLHTVVKQRDELQQMEAELRAQLLARSQIMELQNAYGSQIKEHANANVKLQEQLREKDQIIRELERKIEDKERELHAIRLDTEAAWAKDDLLREQNKELATFRRERDNSEAERAQHLQQIHDLQDIIQEKERQVMELQEQHRVAQETIIYKDEQLREAQTWITRAQEMDVLHSNTNHTLQAELRERTEQYNHLWMGCQRQFAELERLHLHAVQQLQLELADARERSGSYSDESHGSQTNTKDASQFGRSNGGHLDVSGNGTTNGNSGGLPNGNADNISTNDSGELEQIDNVSTVPIAPQSLLGLPTYLPPGQVTALHPFVMHQQGVPQSVPSHVAQTNIGHFLSVPAISSLQHWQNQQPVSERSQMPMHYQYPPSQSEKNSLRPDTNYDYEVSANRQALRPEYMDSQISQGIEPHTAAPSPSEEGQVIDSIDNSYMVDAQRQLNLQKISSQFQDALKLNPLEHSNWTEEKNVKALAEHELGALGSMMERPSPASGTSEVQINLISETTMINANATVLPGAFASTGLNTSDNGKSSEITLLDRGSLLGCIVRTIPPSGRIRISSTLPNRLGKMLAPLHWHDYKKKYGKLDDFVASHPELFVIEGDYIQLKEGAQEIIAATAALAKVKAAASAPSSYSSLLPSVAVTPMAQSQRLKKAPPMELNGAETRPGQSAVPLAVGNGAIMDKSDIVGSHSRGSNQGRPSANSSGKQQGRTTGNSSSSRR